MPVASGTSGMHAQRELLADDALASYAGEHSRRVARGAWAPATPRPLAVRRGVPGASERPSRVRAPLVGRPRVLSCPRRSWPRAARSPRSPPSSPGPSARRSPRARPTGSHLGAGPPPRPVALHLARCRAVPRRERESRRSSSASVVSGQDRPTASGGASTSSVTLPDGCSRSPGTGAGPSGSGRRRAHAGRPHRHTRPPSTSPRSFPRSPRSPTPATHKRWGTALASAMHLSRCDSNHKICFICLAARWRLYPDYPNESFVRQSDEPEAFRGETRSAPKRCKLFGFNLLSIYIEKTRIDSSALAQ